MMQVEPGYSCLQASPSACFLESEAKQAAAACAMLSCAPGTMAPRQMLMSVAVVRPGP